MLLQSFWSSFHSLMARAHDTPAGVKLFMKGLPGASSRLLEFDRSIDGPYAEMPTLMLWYTRETMQSLRNIALAACQEQCQYV